MNKKTALITSVAAASFLGITAVATVSIVNELNNRHSMSQDELALTASGLTVFSEMDTQLPDLPQVGDLPLVQPLSNAATTEPSNTNITMDTAESLVLSATGAKLQNSAETIKKGIAAYAITVLRSDKSIITGFVDKSSGVIFDWETVKAGVPSGSYDDDDDYDDDDYDDDDDDYDDDDD